jgi:hypothetical protein
MSATAVMAATAAAAFVPVIIVGEVGGVPDNNKNNVGLKYTVM